MAARTAGRSGRPWRRAREQTLDPEHGGSDICWLCGHPGAATVDHEPPRSVLIAMGLDPNDQQYLHPAHGTDNECPTCGRRCNQERGTGAPNLGMPHSRDW